MEAALTTQLFLVVGISVNHIKSSIWFNCNYYYPTFLGRAGLQ